MKSYGKLSFFPDQKLWKIEADPHVMIRLKNFFPRVNKSEYEQVTLHHNQEVCRDIEWFLFRYPLEADASTLKALKMGADGHRQMQTDLELVMTQNFRPREFLLAKPLRDYQARSVEIYLRTRALLVADQLGLGKTVTAIGSLSREETLPTLVVCQTHLTRQWTRFLAEFLPMSKSHVIKTGRPYTLPTADVYIITYHKLAGWADILAGQMRSIIFDEVQELRHSGTGKYRAAQAIRSKADFSMGLSATPIYNYGGEMFNVMEVLNPGKLGARDEFNREWCSSFGDKYVIKNPKAFGAYLRDNFLMLRHTRKQVGMELPAIERVVQTIPYSADALEQIKNLATELAHIVLKGTFEQSGQAAREFDMRLRQATGIAKSAYVAEFVRMLVEDGEQVLLLGCHRDVYDVWLDRFKQARIPAVMYTGTESPKQKDDSLNSFAHGFAKVLIMSLRSGSGVDGIQVKCRTCVFGELDWSPGVHEQCIGRLNRDGTAGGVTSFFLVADGGSDPVVAEVLGLKTAQLKGTIDPQNTESVVEKQTDMARVKRMATEYLERHKSEKEYVALEAEGGATTFSVIDGEKPPRLRNPE
jgi:superfamily II DNA or RNA helicase